MNIIKPIANQISLSATGNTVYGAPIVFISTATIATVNVISNTGTTTGTFTLPANQYIYVQKLPTDLLTANATVYATPAGYRG